MVLRYDTACFVCFWRWACCHVLLGGTCARRARNDAAPRSQTTAWNGGRDRATERPKVCGAGAFSPEQGVGPSPRRPSAVTARRPICCRRGSKTKRRRATRSTASVPREESAPDARRAREGRGARCRARRRHDGAAAAGFAARTRYMLIRSDGSQKLAHILTWPSMPPLISATGSFPWSTAQ